MTKMGKKEIKKLINKWECLTFKLNNFCRGVPLRYKVDITSEMKSIRMELESNGYKLDMFGRWV